MHDDGRQPIAIGHLSDSGDLKKTLEIVYLFSNILLNIAFTGNT